MSTPRTFTDSVNRVWTVSVVYNTIVNVLAQTGIDLRQLPEDHDIVWNELDNPAKLKDVLGIILDVQLQKANITIDALFQSITSEAQATAMVMAVVQATFDFFQAQGGVMNDVLDKMNRAHQTAKRAAADRMANSIANGQLDAYLAIVTNPDLMSEWVMASQNATANPSIAAAWQAVVEADLPPARRLHAFIRLAVERGLTLPATAADPAATNAAPTKIPPAVAAAAAQAAALANKPSGQTPSTNAGGSPASAASTQANSVGGS